MFEVRQKIPILRISDHKDLFENTNLLLEYIQKHDIMVQNRFQRFWDAYTCHNAVFDYTINKKKPDHKPDNRFSAGYPRYIVDTYCGFYAGIPVQVTVDEAALAKIMKGNSDREPTDDEVAVLSAEVSDYISTVMDSNDLADVDAEIVLSKCIMGEAYQIIFTDEDAEIGVVPSDPLESFPVYNNGMRPKVRYFIRTYLDEDGQRHGSISDDTYVKYFDVHGSSVVWTEEYPHGFPGVPVSVYEKNKARIGVIEPVLPLADAVDHALCDKMNDIDAFADAVLYVGGVKLLAEHVSQMRDMDIINLYGKDAHDAVVQFLTKPSGDGTQEHFLERANRLLFTMSMVCDVSDNNFATSSGIALKMKMTPMANQAAGDWRHDQAGMKRFWKLVFGNPTNQFPADTWKALRFNHSLNYPNDLADAVDTAAKLVTILSRRTALSTLPGSVVPDVDAEMEQIKKEQEEAADAAAKQAKRQADAAAAAADNSTGEQSSTGTDPGDDGNAPPDDNEQ